jgi:hypothetical protein
VFPSANVLCVTFREDQWPQVKYPCSCLLSLILEKTLPYPNYSFEVVWNHVMTATVRSRIYLSSRLMSNILV